MSYKVTVIYNFGSLYDLCPPVLAKYELPGLNLVYFELRNSKYLLSPSELISCCLVSFAPCSSSFAVLLFIFVSVLELPLFGFPALCSIIVYPLKDIV